MSGTVFEEIIGSAMSVLMLAVVDGADINPILPERRKRRVMALEKNEQVMSESLETL